MQRSTDRILTTHTGSLVRPVEIVQLMRRIEAGEPVDAAELSTKLRTAVAGVVKQQADAGVDVPSDGEFGKRGWTSYISERLGGLESFTAPYSGIVNSLAGAEIERYRGFYEMYNRYERTLWLPAGLDAPTTTEAPSTGWRCVGPITYTGQAAIQRDVANLKAAMTAAGVDEAFLPVAAPCSVEATRANSYYDREEDYLFALADALHEEYRAIVDAGLLLQVDDAFMPAVYPRMLQTGSEQQYRDYVNLTIDALNHALEGIPEDRVRYHICWGSQNVPHTWDVPLDEIVDLMLRVKAQAYVIEAANPRHEHEWTVWQDTRLPEGKILVPGVVTHSTNVVEHPRLVAQRIENFARLVGRENVIAGTDCGFSQNWNLIRVHPEVQWAKLGALAEGAELASERLWA